MYTMHIIFAALTFHLFTTIICSTSNITGNGLKTFTTSDTDLTNLTILNSAFTDVTIPNNTFGGLNGKDNSLHVCRLVVLESGDYELFPNGTLYVEAYNITINESLYVLKIASKVSLCMPNFSRHGEDSNFEDQNYLSITSYMTLVGLAVSMTCLVLHLVAFAIVPDLRNLPGWNLAALCVSLLISYVVFIISNHVRDYKDICFTVALLCHFFMLSAFLWMSIMSFDVFMSLLRATRSFRTSNAQYKWKKFGLYSLCSFGVAFVFTLCGLLADVLDAVPEFYKPNYSDMCWFSQKTPLLIFFAAPVLTLICLNFIFFVLSTYTIYANRMRCACNNALKRSYFMYLRLSVIMGLTWIVGIVATSLHSMIWLWYLFVGLNTLQGLFIFLAFTCSKKVKKFLRKKFVDARNIYE